MESRKSWLMLAVILTAALLLRLHAINFGLPGLNDPDELMFELGALRMLRTATLNPGWFGHPATLTMYVLAVIDIIVYLAGLAVGMWSSVGQFAGAIYHDPGLIILPGRIMIALCAIATIVLTTALGTSMVNRRVGLLAGVLLAVNPVHVAYSQIVRSDMMGCVFMLACLLTAVRIARQNRRRDYVWAAFWLACAVACKWPFAITATAIIGAAQLATSEGVAKRGSVTANLLLFAALSIAFLAAIAPYLLIDWRTVMQNLHGEAQQAHLGATGGTMLQNMGWYVRQPLEQAFGIAGLLLFAFGLFVARRTRILLVILGLTGVAFFILISSQNLVWERWALPVMPIMAIFAGLGLERLTVKITQWTDRTKGAVVSAIILAVLCVPLASNALASEQASLNDTRQRAAGWVRTHVPPGKTVFVEHFAFDLLPGHWKFLFPMGDAGCVDPRNFLSKRKGYSSIQQARGTRSIVDYGNIPAEKRHTCDADYALLSQYMRYRDERGRFPAEYEAYQKLISSGKIVATFEPKPGVSAGPAIVVVKFDN
ncbi:MAG: glycosyltransferase family 39 protein [Sphingomonadaceae bacterium]